MSLLDYGFTVFGERVGYAEFFGQLCALAVVLLAERRTVWTWPVNLAAPVLLFFVYLDARLGGLAVRQVVILAISAYGWWRWVRRKDPVHGVIVRKATWPERVALLAALVGGTVVVALVLDALDASWAPWPDAWIFVGTLVAFAGQGLGLIEFWPVWIAVDAVGVPLQIASGLYFSALVYVVFVVLVIRGWRRWARTAREQASTAAAVPTS